MKKLLFALAFAVAAPAAAQMPVPVPTIAPAEPGAIPLYSQAKDGSAATENWVKFGTTLAVRNVTAPTITPFLPDPAKATGAAVVVNPGGAFMILAMEHEGWSVGRWLADHGIAAFVLKYRLIPTPKDEAASGAFMGRMMAEALKDPAAPPTIKEPRATFDALAALRMVRANAGQWGVDPKRVGMMGFSAGAMTTMNATLEGTAADRPAFIGYIYGPQLPVAVPEGAPPMFAAIAMDDELFPNLGFGVVQAWHKAGRPVELHAYERGGHGFGGLGKPGTTTTLLLNEFEFWLRSGGWLDKRP